MDECGSVILKVEVHSLVQIIHSLSLSFHASRSVGTGHSFRWKLTLTGHLTLELSYSSP